MAPKPQIATLPELDLFVKSPLQESVENVLETEHRPVTSLSNNTNNIEIVITSAPDEYLMLNEFKLNAKVKFTVTRNGSPKTVDTTEWAKISPANLLLHSMFRGVEVELNGRPITGGMMVYPYKSHLQTLLGFTKDAQESHLSAAGFECNWDNTEKISTVRSGWVDGPGTSGIGDTLDLCGKLFADPFSFQRALIGGTEVKIILTPNSMENLFVNKLTDSSISMTIEDLVVHAKRLQVAEPVRQGHLAGLMRSPAIYEYPQTDIKSFQIASLSSQRTIDNIVNGVLPRRVVVGFVTHKAFAGDFEHSMYNFKDLNVSSIQLTAGGRVFPAKPFTPNYGNTTLGSTFLCMTLSTKSVVIQIFH